MSDHNDETVAVAYVCEVAPSIRFKFKPVEHDLVAFYPTSSPGLAVVDRYGSPWVRVRVDLASGSVWSVFDHDWASYDQVEFFVETLDVAFPGIGESPEWALYLADTMSEWAERREYCIPDVCLPTDSLPINEWVRT